MDIGFSYTFSFTPLMIIQFVLYTYIYYFLPHFHLSGKIYISLYNRRMRPKKNGVQRAEQGFGGLIEYSLYSETKLHMRMFIIMKLYLRLCPLSF